MVNMKQVLAGSAAVAAVSALGYLIWFDQKRQKDPKFRRKLKAQARKDAEQRNLAENRARQARERETTNMGAAIDPMGPIPDDPEERAEYFMKLLQYGETLASRGPSMYPMAAGVFFKAIQAYHDPMNLLMVLQQSLPEQIMVLIMELYAADLKRHQKEYFDHFPPGEQNVKMTPIPTNAAGKKRRAVLVTKACKAGDEIFHEEAVVSVPTSTEGIICSYCLTSLPTEAEAATQCEKCKTEHYCGSACETKAKDEYHTVLCSESQAGRALTEYCAEKRTVIPLLVGRFLMKMVKEENKKKEGKTKGPGKYSDWDHLERLFDLPRKPTEEATAEADQEVKLLKAAIAPHVPGFEDFLTTDRYASIKGKLTYNSFGITSSNPSALTTVHLVDTPRGPTVPVAIGHYRTAPLIAHNCTPSATMTYKGDTASIIAAKDLEAGDEVTLDWASVAEMDTSARRKILKERFAFFCRCETCAPTSANSVVENVAA